MKNLHQLKRVTFPSMEDLNDLAIFAAIVVHGSLSAASRALGIPKSRVSRRLAELEERLGVRLLQRSTRAIRVTEVGSAFFSQCEIMLNAAKAAVEVAEHAGARPAGKLRVSCPMGVAHVFLKPLLPRFLNTYPDIRLELDLTNRRVDVIGEGFDVAIRIRSVLDDSNLIVRTLGASDLMLVASPEFIRTCGPFDSIESLQGIRGVGPGGIHGEPATWKLYKTDGTAVEIGYAVSLATDDVHLLADAAAGGVGMAVLPFSVCKEFIEKGALISVLPEYRAALHHLHAVFPSRRGVVPAVRTFVEFLAEHVPQRMQHENQVLRDLLDQ